MGQAPERLVDEFDLADDGSPYQLLKNSQGLYLIRDWEGQEVIKPQKDMEACVDQLHKQIGVDPHDPL